MCVCVCLFVCECVRACVSKCVFVCLSVSVLLCVFVFKCKYIFLGTSIVFWDAYVFIFWQKMRHIFLNCSWFLGKQILCLYLKVRCSWDGQRYETHVFLFVLNFGKMWGSSSYEFVLIEKSVYAFASVQCVEICGLT